MIAPRALFVARLTSGRMLASFVVGRLLDLRLEVGRKTCVRGRVYGSLGREVGTFRWDRRSGGWINGGRERSDRS